MIKLGIIGHPLKHTLSPVMHKAALEYLGIEGNYFVLDTPPEDLFNRVKRLRIENYRGFNVTIPLKVWIVPLLNEVDEYANVAGAVNTVTISEDKKLYGYNTDIDGFIEAIPDNIKDKLKGKKAAVMGAGGAARAVGVALCALGLEEIVFYSRSLSKGNDLKNIICANFPNVNIRVNQYNEFAELGYASILVNSTPLGMEGIHEDISPINKRAVESLAKDAIIYDLVYKPEETKLIRYAKERDVYTINGLEMLVLQGAKALSLWLGQEVPVNVMREAALKSLRNE